MQSGRNTKADSKLTVKYLTVPGDVIIDILYILVSNELLYQIKSINRNENSILLCVEQDKKSERFLIAIENIETILNAYNEYLSGIPS